MRPLLERAIREDQLSGLVELMGPRTQEQVSQLLPTANCYVQPSVITSSGKMEGIPVAIMEAMASGIPVVATSISGIPELVRQGDTGWLVPPEDIAALTDALEQVYHDPTEAHKRAQAGKQWVLAEFELYSNVKKLSSLFAKASLFSSAG
jgi:glycosyltransferase involved in cell wall biosynthesis